MGQVAVGIYIDATEMHAKGSIVIDHEIGRPVRPYDRVVIGRIGEHQEVLVLSLLRHNLHAVKGPAGDLHLEDELLQDIAPRTNGLVVGVVQIHNVLLEFGIETLNDVVRWNKVPDGVWLKHNIVGVSGGNEFHGIKEIKMDKTGGLPRSQRNSGPGHHVPSKTTRSLAPRNLGWFCCGQTVPKKRPRGRVLAVL